MAQEGAERHCSFCRKQRSGVAFLIAGLAGVCICDECVALCSELMADELPSRTERATMSARPWWRFWDR